VWISKVTLPSPLPLFASSKMHWAFDGARKVRFGYNKRSTLAVIS
jgi:hypothetical protein